MFILLSCLQQIGVTNDSIQLKSKLLYKVRKAADKTLQGFIVGKCKGDESIQDIAALKKAWRLCQETVNQLDAPKLFGRFLLENIKIIYIKLDEHQKEAEVFSMMNKAKALFIVSHSTDTIKNSCDRAIWLDKGRIMYDGPAHETIAEYTSFLKSASTGNG